MNLISLLMGKVFENATEGGKNNYRFYASSL